MRIRPGPRTPDPAPRNPTPPYPTLAPFPPSKNLSILEK